MATPAVTPEAPAVTDVQVAQLRADLSDAVIAACWNPASTELGLQFASRLQRTASFTTEIPTAAVGSEGLKINPTFFANCTPAQRVFVAMHEIMHYVADHLGAAVALGIANETRNEDGSSTLTVIPGKDHEAKLHNIAGDCWINGWLIKLAIGQPVDGIITTDRLAEMTGGKSYAGENTSDAIYHWLCANVQKPPPGGGGQQPGKKPGGKPTPGSGEFGNGCAPTGAPATLDTMGREQARAAVREQGIGSGSAFAEALKPKAARVDWRKILRNAFETASVEAEDRSERSFARANRRQTPEIIMPGLIGTEARMAVIVDVSGSVGAEWASRAAAYILKLGADFPGIRVFLATHTSELCWSGWVTPETDATKIAEALAHTGGTDAEPAYTAAREAAKGQRFDVLVHFTDCELPSWPDSPAKRTIVGVLCQTSVPAGLPTGARGVLVTP